MKIEECYFVKKGQGINNAINIKDKVLASKVLPPFVKSGDVHIFDHHKLGYDPYPKKVKDFVVIIDDNGTKKRLKFSEEYFGEMGKMKIEK